MEISNNSVNPNRNSDRDTPENIEWELSDLADAIAAEIDRAQDTLSLKSYARGLSFAIKKLSLDIEVKARRTAEGKFLFRTVDPDETSATVLKLDFSQVFQNQLTDVRKSLDRDTSIGELAFLKDISPDEINALNTVGIYSSDDLDRYSQTTQMLTELSRKTSIKEDKIRMWRGLPFITEIKPEKGFSGSIAVIEGGNFGTQANTNNPILFQQHPVKIIDWRDTRLTVEMPSGVRGRGLVVVRIGDRISNTMSWEAIAAIDLCVRDITISPSPPIEGEEILVKAILINQGNMDSGNFKVQWQIDEKKPKLKSHGSLRSHQHSEESNISCILKLKAGSHRIRFTADPEGKVSDINPTNNTFIKEFVVEARKPLQNIPSGG